MTLVFCEIIEINFCGLSENTKNKIVERAEIEVIYLEENELNDEDDENIGVENLDDSLVYEQEL